tara:strand:- start:55 stop:294 length:240 start_codon:yes stop_codon:yes gene_type:complete
MERIVKMPRMGMNVDEGTIVEWHVKEGQSFSKGDALYSIETDKTTAEIEAPCDGVLNKIHANIGDDISVGDLICSITET